MLTDTSIISVNNGDILRWNGTQFVNSSTLTNDETILNTGVVVSTGITKTQSVTQKTPLLHHMLMEQVHILYIPLATVYIIQQFNH